MGELLFPLVCAMTQEMDKRATPTTYGRQENWLQSHQSGRAGPAPHLLQHSREQTLHLTWGNTVELTLMAEVQVSWPQWCECGRDSLSICLSYGCMGEGEISSLTLASCHLWQVGELSLSLTCWSTRENGPFTSPWQHIIAGPG